MNCPASAAPEKGEGVNNNATKKGRFHNANPGQCETSPEEGRVLCQRPQRESGAQRRMRLCATTGFEKDNDRERER
jgi:hypothetical protein